MTHSAAKPADSDAPAPPAAGTEAAAPERESWRSEELLGQRNEVLIVHGSEVYRLRRTRQDKLILYK
jgi:hemin uptake protein HemP